MEIVKYTCNRIKLTPYFTGLPPHITLLYEMESLKDTMKTEICELLTTELNNRDVGGVMYH